MVVVVDEVVKLVIMGHDPSTMCRLAPPWHALVGTVQHGHLLAIWLALGSILSRQWQLSGPCEIQI